MRRLNNNAYLNIFFTVLWIYVCYGFIAETFFLPLQGMKSSVFFLCDAIVMVLGILHLKSKKDLLFLAGFLILAIWATLLDNSLGLMPFANGFRDFYSLFLAVPFLKFNLQGEFRGEFIDRMEVFFKYFLVIQIPCSTWQFLNHGAGDSVGGSMGAFNSGILTTLIFIITFYFISKNFDSSRYFFSLRNNMYLFIFWFPSFINETKVSFIYIPMFFLCLMKIDSKILFKYLGFGVIFILIIFPILFKAYVSISGNEEDALTVEFFMTAYLNDDEFLDNMEFFESDEDMPRFTKIITSYGVLGKDGNLTTGEGIGHFKGSTTVSPTAFAQEYAWLLTGSVPYIFFIFVQLGIVGVIFIIYYIIYYLYLGFKNTTIPLTQNITLFLLGIFVITLFYNDSLRFPYLAIPYLYILMYCVCGVNPSKGDVEE